MINNNNNDNPILLIRQQLFYTKNWFHVLNFKNMKTMSCGCYGY